MEEKHTTAAFDPLDMNNYSIEKLPKVEKKGFAKLLATIGGPLAIVVFILLYWVVNIPFIDNIDVSALGSKALARYEAIGAEQFIRINYAMLAIFAASIILWITEAIPNYLTSLIVILLIVLTHVTTEKVAFNQLGHPVMWLNILSFVLASMLVKTRVAKRFALWVMINFGKTPSMIILCFLIINLVLSAFISATTAKAAILLPIFMVIAAIYGATGGQNRNNVGRNIVLQNLFQINVGASGFMTGSGANLLAVSLMLGALGGSGFGYQDWLVAALPLCLILLVLGWFVGTKVIFPIKGDDNKPKLEGGRERLVTELEAMGKISAIEYRAIAIFLGVLILWATESLHGISATTVAFIGAVVALLPKIGIITWNDVDIPWHLMLFSAGAYTIGSGFDATDITATMVNAGFDRLGVGSATPFWVIFAIMTGLMLFSALIFQSKTMRTMVFIPIALGIEKSLGFQTLSLAFPTALLIEHVYVLPFNSKPAALLYTTDQYSYKDTFKFGFTMMCIAWVMIFIWGETILRWLGYTNGIFF